MWGRWMRSDTNHWSQRSSVVVLRQSHQLRHHLQPCSTSRGGRAKLTPLASWAARRVPRSLPPTSPPPGVRVPPQCPTCPGARLHESYECPRRYARLCREPCPGFDADGKAIPGAWSGTTLTAATRTAWLDYIKDHGLKRSKHVTSDVSF